MSHKSNVRTKRLRAQGAALARLLAGRPGAPCLLCGGPAIWRGIFLPTDSVVYGGNALQQRLIGYSLCAVHAHPRDLEAIEACILRRIRQGAAPWN